MQTVLQIIEKAGGSNPGLFLKIENAPYMALVIEAIEQGPAGLPAVSITHYGEQNGDLMRDPEMCFELRDGELDGFYYRNDYVGVEQWSRNNIRGQYAALANFTSNISGFPRCGTTTCVARASSKPTTPNSLYADSPTFQTTERMLSHGFRRQY